MRRRNLLPFVILGVLGLLAAGAAILAGLFESPNGTDLAVHNAAGETLGAGTVSGAYTATTLAGDTIHFTFTSPDRVTVYFTGPVKERPQRADGPTAVGVLSPVRALQSLHGFAEHGSLYLVSEPLARLAPANERAAVRGTFRAVATVATGYVVRVQEHLAGAETELGQSKRITDRLDYRLSRIDGWTAS